MRVFIPITIGHAGRLNDRALKRAIDITATIVTTVSPGTAISIVINGYGNDPREIYQIPEARQYVLRFMEGILRHKISVERFLDDTQMLVHLCLAAELGTPIVLHDEYFDLPTALDRFFAKTEKTLH